MSIHTYIYIYIYICDIYIYIYVYTHVYVHLVHAEDAADPLGRLVPGLDDAS